MVAEPGDDEDVVAPLGDHLDRLVVGVGRVLDHVDARLDAQLDAVVAAHVRGDLAVARVRLPHRCLDLLERVHRLLGRDPRAAAEEALARHVHLDDVAALLDVLADGLAHLVDAVGEDRQALHPEPPERGVPVEHPAGRADVAAGCGEPRPDDDPLLDRVADRHVDAVQGAGARGRGVAAPQRELGVLHRVDRRELRRQLQVEVRKLADAPERDVEVALGEARHQGLALQVEHSVVAVRVLTPVGGPADVRDAVALDPDGPVLDGLAAVAVDQLRVDEEGRRLFEQCLRHAQPPV